MARQRKSDRVVASVALVVHPGDRKLAAMRSASRGGRLSLLGGHVELGEDPALAAIREAGEESGGILRVARVRLLGAWPAEQGVGQVAAYLAVKWEALGELIGSPEGPALWASRADLLSPADGAFPAWTARLLEAYDAWLRLPPPPNPFITPPS